DSCPVCEAPAFPVAKTDPHSMLAFAYRGRIVPMVPSTSVPPDAVPVLVRNSLNGNDSTRPTLRFKPTELTSDFVAILFDPSGPLQLELLTESTLKENVLALEYGTWSDSSEIFRQMLLARPRGKRRLLAFEDNREKVSRTVLEARDYFASVIFCDLLRRNRDQIDGSALSDAIRYLEETSRVFRSKA